VVRRTLLALVGFSVAVTVLVGLKSASTARLLGWSVESEFGPDGVSGDTPQDPGDSTGQLADATGQQPGAPGTADPAATGTAAAGTTSGAPNPPAGSTSGSSSRSLPPATTAAASRTYTGVAVAVRTAQTPTTKSSSCGECANYTIAVTITVAGGRITKTTVAYNPSPGGSQSYASSANNKLSSPLVNAQTQTWNLGRVSGATYSGNAWELSVKDAMAKAGLPV
jgi:uncharacterized protein with FMN-binding domain